MKEELTDLCYRFILTSSIALFLFLEIYNFYDPELIERKNIISILIISLSFNVLLLIFHKIHFYLFPAIFLVIALFILFTDENDAALLLESVLFKLLIIGFAAFIIFLTSDNSTAVNIILSAGLIIYMMILLFRQLDIHPVSPALALFYIFFSAARVLRHSKVKEATRLRRYMTFLLPFLIVFPLTIALIPKPENPISWKWAKRLYDMAVEKINEISHELSMSFSSSEEDSLSIHFGYNDSMEYDNSSDNAENIMELYTESNVYGSCYLKGEIFNVFENGNWKNTLESKRNYSAIDIFETFYGVLNFDRDVVNDILKKSNLKIKYLDLTTRIMFIPSKILPISKNQVDNDAEKSFSYKNEHLLFNRRRTYGTEYNVNYYQINYGSVPFFDFMNSILSENDEAFLSAASNYLGTAYQSFTKEDLSEYRDYVKRYYSSSPIVRDSVRDWVNTVTEGFGTDYEKLKAIEHALSSYEYSLEGGQLPDYVSEEGDFLNYFLIEKKSGYCVHYATAFCLIARYMGFPARIVQGYITPVEAGTSVLVQNNRGHSWPEVYFEGKGWIAFEPTPGFGQARYGRWSIYSGKYSDFAEPTYDFNSPRFSFDRDDEPITAEDEDYTRSHTERRVSGMLILIIVSIIIISLILLLSTTIIINRIKKKHSSPEKLYCLEFKSVMTILKELGITRARDETLTEFFNKCRITIADMMKEIKIQEDDCLTFVISYEKFLYGNLEVGKSEINEISVEKDKLLQLMKKKYKAAYPIHKLRIYFSSSTA